MAVDPFANSDAEPPSAPPPAAVAVTRAAGQRHLFAHWDRLDTTARRRLLGQLAAIDWPLVGALTGRVRDGALALPAAESAFDLKTAITPPCRRLHGADRADGRAVGDRGREALAAGAVGAILVAGGQGTRLGCTGPKGLCAVGPLSGATLFEVLLGRLVAIRRRYGRGVPLAIMTSSATDAETRHYLETHAWCGLEPDQVLLFRQQDLPAFDAASADILLDAPDHVALAPDGHGGMLSALAAIGGLDWFRRRGVTHVASFQVDNPLAMPLDPGFLGEHLRADAEFTLQVVRKREPGEKVGVVATSGGVTQVVEYSDLPTDAAAARLPDGTLRLHAGSIAVHAFALDFLARCAGRADALPLHAARKVVACLDAEGLRFTPVSPNAVKFERFIFDLLPLATRVCLVEIDPAEGFAPLKNPSGSTADSPEHVRAALLARARVLLAEAGVAVADGVAVELDAATVLDAEDVAAVVPRGQLIDTPTVVVGPSRHTAGARHTQGGE
ncbi:MAG: UTP--glucose-1-phosphate uridylyltransferase [Pirellulales bacterium]